MTAMLTDKPEPTSPPGSPTAQPGARLALALLLGINLFNFIDRQVLAAVELAIAEEFLPGDPRAEELMGMLPPAFMFTYMLFAPVFGWLADRTSRWLLVGTAVILWSLASGASGLATGFWVLFVTRCFVGIGEAAYGPAAPAIISDLYSVKVRGSVLAWFYMAIPVGSALGYVLGGLCHSLTGDWRWAFYAVVPPGLLLGLWCYFMPEPTRGQVETTETRTARLQDYLVLLRIPSYLLDTLGMAAMTFAMGGMAYWMPRFIVRDRQHLDLGTVNLVFGGIVVLSGLGATFLGGLIGDKLRDRFPGSYFLVSGTAMLLGFPFVLLVVYLPFPLAWVFVFLACFCLFFNTGPTNTILANVAHPAIRASAFALNIFIIHALGDAISPWIIGWLASRHGLDLGFTVVSLAFLLAGLLWLWGARHLERDTLLAPTRLVK